MYMYVHVTALSVYSQLEVREQYLSDKLSQDEVHSLGSTLSQTLSIARVSNSCRGCGVIQC